jgi:protein ImuB
MSSRFVAIWFRHLIPDWHIRRRPALRNCPFVVAAPEHGRAVVRSASKAAQAHGIGPGGVVADARAVLPSLLVLDETPGLAEKTLTALAEWCLRYTPVAAADTPDGLILNATGCAHLWKGERPYMAEIFRKLAAFGYDVRLAMADTIGTAWAVSRYGKLTPIVPPGGQRDALMPLPVHALRLEAEILERLTKLGLYHIADFIDMPRSALRRRFGQSLLTRLDHALGHELEELQPVRPPLPFAERLPCLEPIRTATGIEIALMQLLQALCERLQKEGKGLRSATLKCFRVDGETQEISISTVRASRTVAHLFKLFELKISRLEPDLGFELFVLEAPVVEDVSPDQETLWEMSESADNTRIVELLDRVAGRLGEKVIHRYLPAEHYWPERSYRLASSLHEKPQTIWRTDRPRPVHLLPKPEPVKVMVRIPDYPPVHFLYGGKVRHIQKADGPERIEGEWWLENGEARDYYCVEDEEGARYWLFRTGRYDDASASIEPQWYVHGFFA